MFSRSSFSRHRPAISSPRDLRQNDGYRQGISYRYTQPNSVLFEAWPRSETTLSNWLGGERRAYLLGLFVGDGTLKVLGSKYITCGSSESAEYVASQLRLEFGCRTTVYFNTRAWYVGSRIRYGSEADATDALVRSGLRRPVLARTLREKVFATKRWEAGLRGTCRPASRAMGFRRRLCRVRPILPIDFTSARPASCRAAWLAQDRVLRSRYCSSYSGQEPLASNSRPPMATW